MNLVCKIEDSVLRLKYVVTVVAMLCTRCFLKRHPFLFFLQLSQMLTNLHDIFTGCN